MTKNINPEQDVVDVVLIDNLRVFVVPVDILDVPDLTMKEKMAYICIRSFCNPQGANAFPSYNTIARKCSMSRSSAIRAVDALLEKGLLHKEARLDVSKNRKIRNTSNLYTLEHPAKALKTGVVSHRHHPSVTVTPPPVSEGHHPQCHSDTLTKSFRTKSFRTKSFKSVSEQSKNIVVEPAPELSRLPRLTDRMDKLHFGVELKNKLAVLVVELGLTDEKAVTALQMTAGAAQEDKLHYWNYLSVVFKEKASIVKASAAIQATQQTGQKRAIMVDELPEAIKRQREKEAQLKAAGIEVKKKTRKVADDPELAGLLKELQQNAPKTGNRQVKAADSCTKTDDKPF